jgi:phosphate transport system protein
VTKEEEKMERHFHEELTELRRKLVAMGESVEKAVYKAIVAFTSGNDRMAERIIQSDDRINRMETDIEHFCLKLLALQQPIARDLRFITAAMKINNDLERMGDHAVNIAGYARQLNRSKALNLTDQIPKMTKVTLSMVKDSLAGFVHGDVAKAVSVCRRDNEVDNLDDKLFQDVVFYLSGDRKSIASGMLLMLISKNLERIADLSTNIAEEVIFIVEAENIKHGRKLKKMEDVRSK